MIVSMHPFWSHDFMHSLLPSFSGCQIIFSLRHIILIVAAVCISSSSPTSAACGEHSHIYLFMIQICLHLKSIELVAKFTESVGM